MKKFLKILLATLLLACGICFAVNSITAEAHNKRTSDYITDEDEVVDRIRDAMVNRKSSVTIYYKNKSLLKKGILDDWLGKAFAETGKPDEGDYLKSHYKSSKMKYNGGYASGSYYFTITIDFSYHSTYLHEQEVTKKVEKIVKELHLKDKNVSDYQKIAAAHEYIRDHVSYGKSNSASSYSVYSACVKGKSVCQGYAGLFYRLMREAGIDCRIITGTSLKKAHAWNIVELKGVFYNVDVTWADTAETNKYFLKGSNGFADHKADAKYLTSAFKRKYPISKSNYSNTEHVWENNYKTTKTASFTTDGYKAQCCTICKKENASNKIVISKVSKVKLPQDTYTYNGSVRRPKVSVADANGNKLREGKDYTLSYSKGRKSVGRYYVTVKLKGDYSGSKNLYFTIRPKAPSSVSIKTNTKKKTATLSWKKSTGASGYAVYCLENPGKNSTYKRLTRTTKTSYTKTKLKSGTTYKFKIVPYYKTKVSGKTVYYESGQCTIKILK